MPLAPDPPEHETCADDAAAACIRMPRFQRAAKYSPMLRLVSEVADMETRLGLVGRLVDPVFQHSRRHYVGFIQDLVKAGSVGFFETAEHVGLFLVAKEAVAQREVHYRCSCKQSTFFDHQAGPLPTGEGLCHVEFQGAPEDAQNWIVGSADIKKAFHQVRIPERLQAFFAQPAVLTSEIGCSGKQISQKQLAPDSLIYLFVQHFLLVFRWR